MCHTSSGVFADATDSVNACSLLPPEEIQVHMPGGQEAGKTNTSLLLDPQGNFLAFGSKARVDYYMHDEKGGMLFEKFKMRLNDKHNGAEPSAQALNGQSQLLLKVITQSLNYVKEEAMAKINRSQVDAMSAQDIKWIVTGQFILPQSSSPLFTKDPPLLCICTV